MNLFDIAQQARVQLHIIGELESLVKNQNFTALPNGVKSKAKKLLKAHKDELVQVVAAWPKEHQSCMLDFNEHLTLCKYPLDVSETDPTLVFISAASKLMDHFKDTPTCDESL